MFKKGIDIPPSQCPTCMKVLDRSAPEDDGDGPSRGDMTVCLHCGEILVFDQNLLLTPVTNEALNQLKISQPDTYCMLTSMSKYVVRRNSAN